MDRSRSSPEGVETLPVFRIISVSTVHITKEDDAKLAGDAQSNEEWMLGGSQYGWILCVPDPGRLERVLATMGSRGYSQAMLNLVRQASVQQVRFLRFDAEECWVPGWPQFEW